MLPSPAPSPPPSPTPRRCLFVFTVISHSPIRNFPNWGLFLLFSSNSFLLRPPLDSFSCKIAEVARSPTSR